MGASIFSIEPTTTTDKFDVAKQGEVTLAGEYSSLSVNQIGGKQYLLGYNKNSKKADTYELSGADPWIKQVDNELDLGGPWDMIEPFQIANRAHLCCYASEKGEFHFFPVTDALKSEYPLHLYHPRYPFTAKLTMVKPLVQAGQVFVMGYNHQDGAVNFWTVSATATSIGKQPPLQAIVIWSHQWAQGWTRFAFFTWGNENFFLKTNDWKPNVNIDHVNSDLTTGTNEVGTYLDLKDAQELDIVHPFVVGHGDPYFLTYLAKTGVTTFYRFHGDCRGWTTVASLTTVEAATQIVPFRVGDNNFAMFV